MCCLFCLCLFLNYSLETFFCSFSVWTPLSTHRRRPYVVLGARFPFGPGWVGVAVVDFGASRRRERSRGLIFQSATTQTPIHDCRTN